MKKFFMLAVLLFTVTISSTALAATWVQINQSKYSDIYVDKSSIKRESNGICSNVKSVIKGFANAGNYEIYVYHYKTQNNKLYVLKEFVNQYTPDGKKVEHHSAIPYKSSWKEVDNKLEVKIAEYLVNNFK